MTLGANTALVQVALDERAGRIIVVAAMDNLTKGTAGGAVQSANLALGLPEELGLTTIGVAP
jgi:N-acetyl-gamma-glutamyl-phosphate reductase